MWRDKMLDVLRLEPSDGGTGPCRDGSEIGGGERQTDRHLCYLLQCMSHLLHIGMTVATHQCSSGSTLGVCADNAFALVKRKVAPKTLQC